MTWHLKFDENDGVCTRASRKKNGELTRPENRQIFFRFFVSTKALVAYLSVWLSLCGCCVVKRSILCISRFFLAFGCSSGQPACVRYGDRLNLCVFIRSRETFFDTRECCCKTILFIYFPSCAAIVGRLTRHKHTYNMNGI